MKGIFANAALAAAAVCISSLIPLQAQAKQCSAASISGNYAYTYSGTVFTPDPLPAAAVGHARLDSGGGVNGTQTHTLGGQAEVEDISGTYTINKDCTGSMTINVSINGQLLRTTTVNTAWDSNLNHARMVFTSLILPDGTNVPVVITADVSRVFSKD